MNTCSSLLAARPWAGTRSPGPLALGLQRWSPPISRSSYAGVSSIHAPDGRSFRVTSVPLSCAATRALDDAPRFLESPPDSAMTATATTTTAAAISGTRRRRRRERITARGSRDEADGIAAILSGRRDRSPSHLLRHSYAPLSADLVGLG